MWTGTDKRPETGGDLEANAKELKYPQNNESTGEVKYTRPSKIAGREDALGSYKVRSSKQTCMRFVGGWELVQDLFDSDQDD